MIKVKILSLVIVYLKLKAILFEHGITAYDDPVLIFKKYVDSVKSRLDPKFGVEPSTSANCVDFELSICPHAVLKYLVLYWAI